MFCSIITPNIHQALSLKAVFMVKYTLLCKNGDD
jgi:hypothetical protein